MIDYEKDRFGTGGFADERMRRAAGLYRVKNGLFIGYDENGRMCRTDQQSAIWLNGGARSGKGNLIIPWLIDGSYKDHIVSMDWKGQNGSISQLQVLQGRHVINYMPRGDRPVVAHNINPCSHIHANSQTLIPDIKEITAALLPVRGGKDSYFQETGQRYIEASAITIARTLRNFTLPRLADAMAMFGTLSDEWLAIEKKMASMPEPSIRQVVNEIQHIREFGGSDAGYNGVKSEIAKAFIWNSDPQIRASISEPFGFCFSELVAPGAPPYLVNIMEAQEFARSSAPVIRALYNCALTYKRRAVGTSRRQVWNLDEVANTGIPWPQAVEWATYGAGYGILPIYITQSSQQLNNLAPGAAKIIPNNAGTHIFMGVRDAETEGQRISRGLGTKTIEHEDFLTNENARLANERAMMRVLNEGADPFQVGMEMAQNEAKIAHRTKAPRAVMTPDEVMNLPNGKAIVFMPSVLERPAMMTLKNYWQRRDLAGRYLADPFHPTKKGDLQVQTIFGSRYRRVIRERVPDSLAHLPQYQDGLWSYVEGYRPL